MRASELASLVGGVLHGADAEIEGVAPLEQAGAAHCAYAVKPPATCEAGVLLCTEPVRGACTVVVPDPKAAFMVVLRRLFPEVHPRGVQPGAHVDPTARLGLGVVVYPGAYVGPDVCVGADTVILPNAVLLRGTQVGAGCVVGPGAVLGHAGFGLHPGPSGPEHVPQVGRVVVGDAHTRKNPPAHEVQPPSAPRTARNPE